jgi:hypothetical protein
MQTAEDTVSCLKRLQTPEFLWIDSRLSQDASERSDCYFAVPWHDGRSGSTFGSPSKFNVAPFLTYLCEACGLEFALDFTIGQWPKRRQPQPLWFSPAAR